MVLHSKKCRQGTNEIPRSATVHSFRAVPSAFWMVVNRTLVVVEKFPIKHQKLCMHIRTFPPDFRPSGTMLNNPLRVAFG